MKAVRWIARVISLVLLLFLGLFSWRWERLGGALVIGIFGADRPHARGHLSGSDVAVPAGRAAVPGVWHRLSCCRQTLDPVGQALGRQALKIEGTQAIVTG